MSTTPIVPPSDKLAKYIEPTPRAVEVQVMNDQATGKMPTLLDPLPSSVATFNNEKRMGTTPLADFASQIDLKAAQDDIDMLKQASNVSVLVDTKAALDAVDKTKVSENDYARVAADETHDGKVSFYKINADKTAWDYKYSDEAGAGDVAVSQYIAGKGTTEKPLRAVTATGAQTLTPAGLPIVGGDFAYSFNGFFVKLTGFLFRIIARPNSNFGTVTVPSFTFRVVYDDGVEYTKTITYANITNTQNSDYEYNVTATQLGLDQSKVAISVNGNFVFMPGDSAVTTLKLFNFILPLSDGLLDEVFHDTTLIGKGSPSAPLKAASKLIAWYDNPFAMNQDKVVYPFGTQFGIIADETAGGNTMIYRQGNSGVRGPMGRVIGLPAGGNVKDLIVNTASGAGAWQQALTKLTPKKTPIGPTSDFRFEYSPWPYIYLASGSAVIPTFSVTVQSLQKNPDDPEEPIPTTTFRELFFEIDGYGIPYTVLRIPVNVVLQPEETRTIIVNLVDYPELAVIIDKVVTHITIVADTPDADSLGLSGFFNCEEITAGVIPDATDVVRGSFLPDGVSLKVDSKGRAYAVAGGGTSTAADVSYNPAASGLAVNNVQAAIDALAAKIEAISVELNKINRT